ncbi:hypothetical protein BHM03_00033824 [Ensete ventricosum]|nr:hypothetical protein BHM03_00033824 [Ensete ventricosum]
MSCSGSYSVRVIPFASSEGTRSEGRVSGLSHSGIPSLEDARSRRDLEVERNHFPFPGNLRYDREVVGRGRALSSFSGCHGSERFAQEAQDAREEERSRRWFRGCTVGGGSDPHGGFGKATHRESGCQLGYRRPTWDLCGMRVREDDEGYYGHHYQIAFLDRVHDSGRLVTHMGNQASLLAVELEKLKS